MSVHETSQSYAELDITPSSSTRVQLHAPRLFIPQECLSCCSKIRDEVGAALLSALQNQDVQYDVVCRSKARVGCNAETHNSGRYDLFGNPVGGSDERFLPSSAIYSDNDSPIKEISWALLHGIQGHSPYELRD